MIKPSVQVVEEKYNALITCNSRSPVKWTKINGEFPSNAIVLPVNKLWITNVHKNNRGYYECHGEYQTNKDFYSFSLLKVLGKANFFIILQ